MLSDSPGVFGLPPPKKRIENHEFRRKNLRLWNLTNLAWEPSLPLWLQDPANHLTSQSLGVLVCTMRVIMVKVVSNK